MLNKLGLVIIFIGATLLVSYGFYYLVLALVNDDSSPIIIKFGILGIFVGFLILLISFIVERFKDKKSDPKI